MSFMDTCDEISFSRGYASGLIEGAKQERKTVLDKFSGFIDAYSRQDEDGHDYVSVLSLQNHIESIMKGEI